MNRHPIKKLAFLFVLLNLLSFWCAAETPEQVVNPKTTRNEWVSDMAGVIDETTERQLNTIINRLEQKTTAEIAVVTIRRTDGRSPKKFATTLFNRWKIGKENEDNGVLVLLVMNDQRIEVETGYGIEGILTDGKIGEILRQYGVPRFKEGDFGVGIFSVVNQLCKVITKGNSYSHTSQEPRKQRKSEDGFPVVAALIFFFVFILIILIGAFSGNSEENRRRKSRMTGDWSSGGDWDGGSGGGSFGGGSSGGGGAGASW